MNQTTVNKGGFNDSVNAKYFSFFSLSNPDKKNKFSRVDGKASDFNEELKDSRLNTDYVNLMTDPLYFLKLKQKKASSGLNNLFSITNVKNISKPNQFNRKEREKYQFLKTEYRSKSSNNPWISNSNTKSKESIELKAKKKPQMFKTKIKKCRILNSEKIGKQRNIVNQNINNDKELCKFLQRLQYHQNNNCKRVDTFMDLCSNFLRIGKFHTNSVNDDSMNNFHKSLYNPHKTTKNSETFIPMHDQFVDNLLHENIKGKKQKERQL